MFKNVINKLVEENTLRLMNLMAFHFPTSPFQYWVQYQQQPKKWCLLQQNAFVSFEHSDRPMRRCVEVPDAENAAKKKNTINV